MKIEKSMETSNKPLIASTYLTDCLTGNGLTNVINNIVNGIERSKIQFDAIAFSGMSGAIVAPSVAMILNKPMMMVRKHLNDTHSIRLIEGIYQRDCRYIIVDDLVSTGSTIARIIFTIHKEIDLNNSCVGVFLYNAIMTSEISSPILASRDYKIFSCSDCGLREIPQEKKNKHIEWEEECTEKRIRVNKNAPMYYTGTEYEVQKDELVSGDLTGYSR